MAKLVDPRFLDCLTPKWRSLLRIREHAIAIAQGCAAVQSAGGASQVMTWNGDRFTIVYESSTQRLADTESSSKRVANKLGISLTPKSSGMLPASRKREPGGTLQSDKLKILEVSWGDNDGRIRVAVFRRHGAWQDAFLALKPGPAPGRSASK